MTYGRFLITTTLLLGLNPFHASAQDKVGTTEIAETCSVIVNGNQNTVSLVCDKSAELMVRQVAAILNLTRSDSTKLQEMSDKLDDLKKQLSQPDKLTVEVGQNGIANIAPNQGTQSVTNVGPIQYPLPETVPNIRVCAEPSKKLEDGTYETSLVVRTDERITRPAFMFYFDKAASAIDPHADGFTETRSGRDNTAPEPQKAIGFYVISMISTSETSWFPRDKLGATIKSQEPLQLLKAAVQRGDSNDENRLFSFPSNINTNCE